MMSQSHFQLVGEKTFAEFELALVNLAKEGPFFMARIYPVLSKEGFMWTGPLREGIKATRLLDVAYDLHEPSPVDFLVLRDRKDDRDYLRRNPKFVLEYEHSSPGRPNLSRVKHSRRSSCWCRILEWLLSWFGRRPSNTVEDIKEERVVRRTGTARVVRWIPLKNCGYLENGKTGEQFYFTGQFVFDSRLKRSLGIGKYGQIVRYCVNEPARGGRLAIVQIDEMIRDYEPSDRLFVEGHAAMISGDLETAIVLLEKVIHGGNSDALLSAHKDLAETYNRRGRVQEAFELIERAKQKFPKEYVSFEMMEVTYLERMNKKADAVEKINQLLADPEAKLSEGCRSHFVGKVVKLRRALEESDDGLGKIVQVLSEQGLTTKSFGALRAELNKLAKASTNMSGSGGTTASESIERVVLKLSDFVKTDRWVDRCAVREFLNHDSIDGIGLPNRLLDAIRDAVDKVLCEHARRPSTLQLSLGGAKLMEDESGTVEVKLSLSLNDASAIPVKNVFVSIEGDREATPFRIDSLSFEEGAENAVLCLRTTCEERTAGIVDCEVSVAFDRDVEPAILMDVNAEEDVSEYLHECVRHRVELRIGRNGFVHIENPFRQYCNHVAEGQCFVGRERLLDYMYETLMQSAADDPLQPSGQSLILYGQSRSGKTSIGRNLRGRLEGPVDSRFFYTEISIHGLTEEILRGSAMECIAYDLMVAVRNKLKSIGTWTDSTKAEYSEIPSGYYARQISFLSSKLRESGFLWIVAIDEFTDLYDLLQHVADAQEVANKILDVLRVIKALLEQRNPAFNLLLIGQDSMPEFKKDFWNKFSVSKDTRVSYLDYDSTVRLLCRPLEGKVKIETLACDRYYYYVGGYPLYAMYFCSALVEYVNAHGYSVIKVDDIDCIAMSFCVGDARFRADEFDPFVQLERKDVNGADLMALYYEVANSEMTGCGVSRDCFMGRERLESLFDLLESRSVFSEDLETGRMRLRMGLFGLYLRKNPGLTENDLRSVKGHYND